MFKIIRNETDTKRRLITKDIKITINCYVYFHYKNTLFCTKGHILIKIRFVLE